MNHLKCDSALICFGTLGDGKPLVLIPGFASGAWSWKWQVEELSKNFKVITFDPRGISHSTITESGNFTISGIVEDITCVLKAINAESAHIMGVSFGGFVAQEFAVRFPDMTDKLVLASTSFGGPNHVPPSMQVLSAFATTDGLNSHERIRQYLTMAFSPEYVSIHAGVVDEFCRLREENIVPEDVYMAQLRAAMTFDGQPDLSSIRSETLVITGDNDTIVPMENSLNLAAAIPNVRLEIIPEGSHMVFVEQAAEFNAIVGRFLKN